MLKRKISVAGSFLPDPFQNTQESKAQSEKQPEQWEKCHMMESMDETTLLLVSRHQEKNGNHDVNR